MIKPCPFCGNTEFNDEIWEQLGGEPQNEYEVNYSMGHTVGAKKKVIMRETYVIRRFCKKCGASGPWGDDSDIDVARKIADNKWDERYDN